MISFSAQRCTRFFRSITALFFGLVVVGSLCLTAQAQNSDELFRGTWQIETPDDGSLIIMVKSQGRASYFWGDNTDRSVYQGTWTSSGETATLTWADGAQHRIARDSLGFGITHTDARGNERYTTQAQQVPSEILGQWAKPPTKQDALISDRDKAKGFFGVWKVGMGDADAEYVFIEPDRSAATTEVSEEGLRGSWARQGSELHIAWDSGHYSILRPNNREFAYKRIKPGVIIEDDETQMRPAVRTIEAQVPNAWMADYRKEREIYTGGIAFSSQKDARAFYRGDWIVKFSEGSFERIEISRFGGLSTTADRSIGGDWRMQGQDIFMRWDDGMRKILSPIGRGFILYEYRPGRPLDGVPTRLRPAAPADGAKLAEHLKGRTDVAQQMLDLAEAAGIDPNQQTEVGWGRTFARWAWPFGEDEAPASTTALLQEEYEEARETDPWWWPFWSEKPAPNPEMREATQESMPEAAVARSEARPGFAEEREATPPEAAETVGRKGLEEAADDEQNPAKKRGSARDWVWPF